MEEVFNISIFQVMKQNEVLSPSKKKEIKEEIIQQLTLQRLFIIMNLRIVFMIENENLENF